MNINVKKHSGHDFSVDLWAIGILIYELTQGEAPFKDPKETLKGIKKAKFSKPVSSDCRKIIEDFCSLRPLYRLGSSKNGFKEVR